MKLIDNSKYFLKNDDGFGLTESVLSILLLSILLVFSTLFITKRLQTKYRANLTDAINDEIKRDIQKIKFELWQEHLEISPNPKLAASRYLTQDPINKRYCDNIEYTLRQLPSWFPNSWEPNSNPNSVSGQLKNKVFKGSPIRITREFVSEKPFNGIPGANLDKSVSKIAYSVFFIDGQGQIGIPRGQRNYWTSIDITSEAHGWCNPSG